MSRMLMFVKSGKKLVPYLTKQKKTAEENAKLMRQLDVTRKYEYGYHPSVYTVGKVKGGYAIYSRPSKSKRRAK